MKVPQVKYLLHCCSASDLFRYLITLHKILKPVFTWPVVCKMSFNFIFMYIIFDCVLHFFFCSTKSPSCHAFETFRKFMFIIFWCNIFPSCSSTSNSFQMRKKQIFFQSILSSNTSKTSMRFVFDFFKSILKFCEGVRFSFLYVCLWHCGFLIIRI